MGVVRVSALSESMVNAGIAANGAEGWRVSGREEEESERGKEEATENIKEIFASRETRMCVNGGFVMNRRSGLERSLRNVKIRGVVQAVTAMSDAMLIVSCSVWIT